MASNVVAAKINVKAIENKDGTLEGLVKVEERESSAHAITGVMVHFEFDPGKNEVSFAAEDAFFYDRMTEIMSKYHVPKAQENIDGKALKRVPDEHQELKVYRAFVDWATKYRDHEKKHFKRKGLVDYYIKVPLDQIALRKEQELLYERAMSRLETKLPVLMTRLERISLDSPQTVAKFAYKFPGDFRTVADMAEVGYKKVWDTRAPYEGPKGKLPRIFYSPIGGLPSWAKPARHR